jgi:magnesium transporter
MPKNRELTLAFLKSRPAEAARVLEQLPAEDTAAFLREVPSRSAAPVVVRLFPSYAAHCLEHIPEDRCVNLLRRLGAPAAAATLRYISDARRGGLLDQMPATTAMACRLLLHFPEDSIGSLVDVEVLQFTPDSTVRDALTRLKSAPDEGGDFVYLIDTERHLRACIRPSSLLQAGGTLALGALPQVEAPLLSAQASPLSVRDHAGWHSYSTLPVIDRAGRFVGALRQSALMQALARSQHAPTTARDNTLEAVAGVYWGMFSGLLQATVSLLPGLRHEDRP